MPEKNEENAITYESFRKYQRKEKNNEKLQDLPEEFFKHCIEWLNRKEEKFTETRNSVLLHEIENVKSIVKDIFNRRRRKILQLALHSVRSKKISKNLLPEEKKFYDSIVEQLKLLEENLLKRVLEGKKPTTTEEKDTDKKKQNVKKNANTKEVKKSVQKKEDANQEKKKTVEKDSKSKKEEEKKEKKSTNKKLEVSSNGEYRLVRITKDVDKFVYDNNRTYGPLKEGDLVTLPKDVAALLEKKDHIEYTEI